MIFLQLLFAGAWASIWHWGVGIGAIIILVLLAHFSAVIPLIGPWLGNERKALYAAAGAVAIFLAGQYVGGHDRNAACAAKEVIIETTVSNAVRKTDEPRAEHTPDPWNRPDN